jgi:2-phospho-L-lactate guanylyltransferase
MRAVLIPVKDLRLAKQRLAPWLPQSARTELAAAMMEDVFAAVAAARGFDAVFVVSNYAPVLKQATLRGWQTLCEERQLSESDSVDRASRELAARGVRSVLRLPIDIPLVTDTAIEELFAAAEHAACVIVPSHNGTGTNALLRTPPDLFPSHFGPQSLSKHLAEAQNAGAKMRVIENPQLALDVDDAEDLHTLMALIPPHTATGRWLKLLGAEALQARDAARISRPQAGQAT